MSPVCCDYRKRADLSSRILGGSCGDSRLQ